MAHNSTIWTSQNRSGALDVFLLGLVDFESAVHLQERLVYEVSGRDDTYGALLVCEHPPLVTIGREGSRAHLLADPVDYTARRIDVRWINRGGGCYLHAPGQLAIYPILPLNRLRLGLDAFRTGLEQSVLRMSAEQKVAAWTEPETAGVWCRCGQFAFVGAAVKSWVSYHGLFVNVCPDLETLRMVQWNPSGRPVASLAAQRMQVRSAMHSVRESLVRNLADGFGYDNYHIYTGHPLLRRTKTTVYVNS